MNLMKKFTIQPEAEVANRITTRTMESENKILNKAYLGFLATAG